MSARAWSRTLWFGCALVAALFLTKYFVADVYLVESGSMRPTLFGGRDRPDGQLVSEHVLVRYRNGFRPRRFDLVVLRAPEGGPPLVKRAVGLPDESLAIRGGDLFLGTRGQHLPPDAPRPAPIPVFDQRWHDLAQFFAPRGEARVTRQGQEWLLEASDPGGETWLEYHPELRDDYLDREHRRVDGIRQVNDAVLELEARFATAPPGARLWLFLVEEGDRFTLELERTVQGLALELRRGTPAAAGPGPAPEVLAREELALDAATLDGEGWLRLRFANIDDHLSAHLEPPGRTLAVSYPGNRPWPRPGLPAGVLSLGPRAGFGVRGGAARVRGVRLARDLYYTDVGTFGVGAPVHLGPDECFLLGDNSAVSTDSRHFGPVAVSELLGTAEAVVWPSWRWLEPVERPRDPRE